MADRSSALPIPDTRAEDARVAALYALDLIDSAPEREFDAVVSLAAKLLDTPFAAVTLVDRERLWVKATFGAPAVEEPRNVSFCTWTIESDEIHAVTDAGQDTRMTARSDYYGGHQVRFYAGAALHAPNGERIGALCVADLAPRDFDEASGERLRELALLVDALIAARATTRDAILIAGESARQAEYLQRQERVMLQAERLAMIGSWRVTMADNSVEWSDNTYRIHGLPIGQSPSIEGALDFYPPHARATVAQALANTIETGKSMDVEIDFLTAQGVARRVRTIGELECHGGQPVAVVGVFQDVTERWTMEQALRRSADQDELTGIANRAAFNRVLEAEIQQAQKSRAPLLLALIDLDGFKTVNDTLGHLAGDDVLKAVGKRLGARWLEDCFAARLGGDEFALIVTDRTLASDPIGFAARLEIELCEPVAGIGLHVGAAGTVGTASFDPDADTQRDLVHRADTALYAAKRRRVGNRRAERRAR